MKDDINLLEETSNVLAHHKKTWEDVRFIKNGADYLEEKIVSIPVDFFKIAANEEYDNGFGGEEVSKSLMIVGDDWWMERHEYDGSEWWEFKTLPQKPTDTVRTVEDARNQIWTRW